MGRDVQTKAGMQHTVNADALIAHVRAVSDAGAQAARQQILQFEDEHGCVLPAVVRVPPAAADAAAPVTTVLLHTLVCFTEQRFLHSLAHTNTLGLSADCAPAPALLFAMLERTPPPGLHLAQIDEVLETCRYCLADKLLPGLGNYLLPVVGQLLDEQVGELLCIVFAHCHSAERFHTALQPVLAACAQRLQTMSSAPLASVLDSLRSLAEQLRGHEAPGPESASSHAAPAEVGSPADPTPACTASADSEHACTALGAWQYFAQLAHSVKLPGTARLVAVLLAVTACTGKCTGEDCSRLVAGLRAARLQSKLSPDARDVLADEFARARGAVAGCQCQVGVLAAMVAGALQLSSAVLPLITQFRFVLLHSSAPASCATTAAEPNVAVYGAVVSECGGVQACMHARGLPCGIQCNLQAEKLSLKFTHSTHAVHAFAFPARCECWQQMQALAEADVAQWLPSVPDGKQCAFGGGLGSEPANPFSCSESITLAGAGSGRLFSVLLKIKDVPSSDPIAMTWMSRPLASAAEVL